MTDPFSLALCSSSPDNAACKQEVCDANTNCHRAARSAHDSLGIHGAEGRTCFVEPFLFEKHIFEGRLHKICEILGQKVVCEEIDDINFEEIHGCTTRRQWQDQAQCRHETGVHETDRLSERA